MSFNIAIDVGNTFTKIGIYNYDSLIHIQKYQSLTVNNLEDLFSKHNISNSIIANSGNYNHSIDAFLIKNTNHLKFNANTSIPIINLYASPKTLGKDRLSGIIGALSLTVEKTPIISIDTGTCITFNFLNENKEYIGGSISPGITMRLQALPHFTAKLPLVDYNFSPVNLTGTNTKQSILSGVVNGILHEIDGMIDTYRNIYKKLTVYVTGGGCYFFENQLKNKIFADPNLVITGLNKIINYNAAG